MHAFLYLILFEKKQNIPQNILQLFIIQMGQLICLNTNNLNTCEIVHNTNLFKNHKNINYIK